MKYINTQREIINNNVLDELRTFVLNNRVSTFWYKCCRVMVRREKEQCKYILVSMYWCIRSKWWEV